jgi:hypothetical protein
VAAVVAVEDISLVGKLRTLFDQARNKRKSRVDTWQRSYKVVHNRSWGPLREAWMPSPQASETYPIVAAMVGWMTDQRPGITCIASMDPHTAMANFYQQQARDLETTLQASWIVNNTDQEVEKMLWDTMIYGTGFLRAGWNQALAGGLGDGELTRIDPFKFYPDPMATSMEDANYFVEARTMSLDECERRWPGSVAKMKGNTYEESGLDEREDVFAGSGRTPMANTGGISGANTLYGRPGRARESVSDDEGITIYEFWLRENNHYTTDEGEVYVEDSWKVVVVGGNHVLFEATADELWGHGRHPYVRYVLHDLGEFWGISLVEHLTPLQININRLLAAIQSNMELIGNPVFVEDARSGIPRTKITNKPGTRLTTNVGSEPKWLVPPEMPREMTALIQFYIGEMERVSGLSAIVRGATPTGRNAQGVLDAVQESAFVRVRLALRNLERSLRQSGELLASLIVENYNSPRMVSIVGPTGEKSSLALKARHFFAQTENGAIPLRFQLWIQAGATLPISRMARAQEADVLFAMGGIDRQALLDAHDYPNRDQIVSRIMQAEAAGMFNPPSQRSATR